MAASHSIDETSVLGKYEFVDSVGEGRDSSSIQVSLKLSPDHTATYNDYAVVEDCYDDNGANGTWDLAGGVISFVGTHTIHGGKLGKERIHKFTVSHDGLSIRDEAVKEGYKCFGSRLSGKEPVLVKKA